MKRLKTKVIKKGYHIKVIDRTIKHKSFIVMDNKYAELGFITQKQYNKLECKLIKHSFGIREYIVLEGEI